MSTTTEPLGGAQLVNPHISVVVVVRGWPGRLGATRRTANPRDEQHVGVHNVFFSHPRSVFMSLSSGKSELKQVDRDFLVDQGAAEIYRHMPGLKKIAERDVPGVPQSQIVFRIDYLTYPPKISLRKHLFDEGHQDLITGLNGGDLLWLEVRVPLGGNSYEQITHFSLARNLWEEGPEDAALPRRRLNFCDQDGNALEVRGDEVSHILLRMQEDSKGNSLPDYNTALALKIVEEVLRADRDEKYFRQSTFVMAAEKQ